MESKILEYLNKIKTAVYGRDVRSAIHDSIQECYTNVTTAETKADTAANKANTAASNADAKATAANTATTQANAARDAANSAANNANTKAGLANTAAENANTKAGLANTAATNANAKAGEANTAAQAANEAKKQADTARDAANSAAQAATTAKTETEAATKKANDAATAATTAKTNAETATAAANKAAENANAKATAADTATGKANTAAASATSAAEAANTAADEANEAKEQAEAATTAANAATEATKTATTQANAAANSANDAASAATTAKTQAETATTAANKATQAANTAAESANSAAESATTAASQANTAKDNAEAATQKATTAATAAESAASEATEAAGVATSAADKANTSAGKADTAASNAGTKANAAEQAATAATNATSSATDAASEANTAADLARKAAELANNAAAGTGFLQKQILEAKPEVSDMAENVLYLVPAAKAGTDNVYDEYMLVSGKCEKIGDTAVDLSGYAKTETMTAELAKKLGKTETAAAATKATQDSAGNNINTTYIKALSASGKTITYTRGDGSTGTITTQDTTYSQATNSALGLTKLYTATGQGQDGAMTQKATTDAINGIEIGGRNLLKDSEFLNGTPNKLVRATASIETKDDRKAVNLTASSDTNNWHYCSIESVRVHDTKGKTYTVSVWVKYEGVGNITVRTDMQLNKSSESAFWGTADKQISAADGWVRISKTAALTDEYETICPMIGIGDNSAAGKVLYIWHPKLEMGNKATDWTPAPEDMATVAAVNGKLGKTETAAKANMLQQGAIGYIRVNNTDFRTYVDTKANVRKTGVSDEMNIYRFTGSQPQNYHLPCVDSNMMIYAIDNKEEFLRIIAFDVRSNDVYVCYKTSNQWHDWEKILDANDTAAAAKKLETARAIKLSGGATGTANFDGSADATINVTALDATKLSAAVPVAKGGTGATTADAARTALGAAAASHTHTTGNANTLGFTKLYTVRGTNQDGAMTQNAVNNALDDMTGKLNNKADDDHIHNYAGSASPGGAANTAVKLATARTINLTGAVTGMGSFDGSANVSITTTMAEKLPHIEYGVETISGSMKTVTFEKAFTKVPVVVASMQGGDTKTPQVYDIKTTSFSIGNTVNGKVGWIAIGE